MATGKGFCLPDGMTLHSKEQLKRWSQMLAQRHAMNQPVEEANKEITKQYIKEKYGS